MNNKVHFQSKCKLVGIIICYIYFWNNSLIQMLFSTQKRLTKWKQQTTLKWAEYKQYFCTLSILETIFLIKAQLILG